MSTNMLDQIATVSIDLETPIVTGTSFNSLLLVGPAPAVAPATAPAAVASYGSLGEVEDAGWVTSGSGADPIGVAAAVAFAQNPKPSKIFIAVIQSVTTNNGGETVTTAEEPTATIARATETDGWYVVCPVGIAQTKYTAIAQYVETLEKMMLYTETNFFSNNNAAVIGTTFTRSGWIFGKVTSSQVAADIPSWNNYAHVALAAKWLSYDSGSETAAFKGLSGIKTSELTTSEISVIKNAHGTCYVSIGNRDLTLNGMVSAGEWMDVIRFRDWLKNDMQVRVTSLFAMNAKIPFTDAGIALIQNAMEASLRAGQEAGGIKEDEFDSDGNLIPGFETSVPDAADISASAKASRILTGCTFRALIAGAIHFAELKGSLTYTL